MKLNELQPGDRIVDGQSEAILIALVPSHPIYPNLSMAIWWMVKEKRYSLDALHPFQDLAPAQYKMPADAFGIDHWTVARLRNLQEALRGQRS